MVRYAIPSVTRAADVAAKTVLIVLLVLALMDQDAAHLRGKAAELRAIAYPVLSFTVPIVWLLWWKDRASFPWLADLLVTMTCFSDILGNRLDLYDTVVWFDDWMHFTNVGLLAAAAILLTLRRDSSRMRIVERALAVGATSAIGWEIGEYFAFISGSSERQYAYVDTLADLGLGVIGAVIAAGVVHALWRHGYLAATAPQLDVHDPSARTLAAGRGVNSTTC